MAEVATLSKPQESKAVVQWKGEAITISFQDVKSLICPLASDQEVAIFLKTCQIAVLSGAGAGLSAREYIVQSSIMKVLSYQVTS